MSKFYKGNVRGRNFRSWCDPEKMGKMGENGEKWGKMGKNGEKWGKMGENGGNGGKRAGNEVCTSVQKCKVIPSILLFPYFRLSNEPTLVLGPQWCPVHVHERYCSFELVLFFPKFKEVEGAKARSILKGKRNIRRRRRLGQFLKAVLKKDVPNPPDWADTRWSGWYDCACWYGQSFQPFRQWLAK